MDGPPRGSLLLPRSYCPHCRTPIARAHLAPLFGYLALRGRCASCAAKISVRYPIVECAGAGAAVVAVLAFGATASGLFAAIFFWSLIALALIDLETGFLPDAIVLPLAVVGVIANAGGRFASLHESLIGAFAGFIALAAIGAAYRKLRGRDGLGLGDAKLLAAIGAWCGWTALAPSVFLGALATLVGVAMVRLQGRKINGATAVPFGPGLCFGGAAILLAQQAIILAPFVR